jgi:hypothetical protein
MNTVNFKMKEFVFLGTETVLMKLDTDQTILRGIEN